MCIQYYGQLPNNQVTQMAQKNLQHGLVVNTHVRNKDTK